MLSCTPTAAWLVSSVTLTNEAFGRALGAGEAGPRAMAAAIRNLQCGMALVVCGGGWQKRTEREREERAERERDCGDA